MKRCDYYDCGWCYANQSLSDVWIEENSIDGACNKPKECLYYIENIEVEVKKENSSEDSSNTRQPR